MFLTNDDGSRPPQQSPAVCIIGAGAAGIALACELDGAGFPVLLIDAGGDGVDPALQALYAGTASERHPDPTQFRRVGFGGTTSIWGGRCVPYDPIDFERRDWIAGSGWPIAYEELAAFYPKALMYCDAGAFDYSVAGSLPGAPPTIPGFDGAGTLMADRIERYSLPTNFGTRYRDRLARSANVCVRQHLRCVALHRAPGEARIAAIEVVDRSGARSRIEAEHFVLAVGGIETARLLLASDPEGPGLGNGSGSLGRYYACHFENTYGRLRAPKGRVRFAFERDADGVYVRRKFQFTEGAQREHQLLNSAFRLHFPEYSDASHGSAVMSAIYLAKSLLIPEYRNILQHSSLAGTPSPLAAHLRNILFGIPQMLGFAWTILTQRVLATRKLPYTLIANADGSYPIEFNCEQTPCADSRISLLAERDRDGVPRVRVDWKLLPDDVEAACRAWRLLRDTINASGAATMEFDDAALRERLSRSVPLGGHHLGTARMAATASGGVVDRDCAVFGLPNLHVASSAVFPTASHANPTLTIVALALRLAVRLKTSLAA